MSQKPFIQFMKSLTDLDNPHGDLARDIFRDKDFPMKKTEKEMISYLEFKTGAGGTRDILKEVLREYKRSA